MATLRINFQANTTGNHIVGYRENYFDLPNTYTTVTLNILTPGPAFVDIIIPGSLYCGQLSYSGYIIAECQNQIDSNADGIPDAAVTWSQIIPQQVDPCIETTIICDSVGILTINIIEPGENYTIGDVIPIIESSPGDEVSAGNITVLTVNGGGGITSVSINNTGLYKAIPLLDASAVVGWPGVINAQLVVTAMSNCPALNIEDFVCATIITNGIKPEWGSFPLGSTYTLCADIEEVIDTLGIQFRAEEVGNCKCRGCERLTLDASAAATGGCTISYNTCWDRNAGEVLNIVQVSPGDVFTNIACVIPETVQILANDLDTPIVISYTNCPEP